MLSNDGKSAEKEFPSLIQALYPGKTHVFRNRDKRDLAGLNKRVVGGFSQPADFTVAAGGGLFYAEVKSTTDPKRFSYANIQPAQKNACLICAACGTPYWFFIYRVSDGSWFRLSGFDYSEDRKKGIKSRSFEELEYVS